MSDLPSYDLELKAADDRRRLHESVGQLRSRVRETLDVKRNASEHLGLACCLSAGVALAAGYIVTGIFLHR